MGSTIDWIGDNVVHPLVNAAAIEPYNTVSHLLQDASGKNCSLGELKALTQSKPEAYSTNWFVQSAMSGLGSLVPFVVSGALTGRTMRGVSGLLGAEGRTASLLASDRVAQLAGAGIFAGMKRPQEGETRLGNAAGTVAAFGLFDAGNSLTALPLFNKAGTLSFAARSTLRIGTGLTGGIAQAEIASLVSRHKLADTNQTVQSAVGAAFLNFGLGSVHDIARGDNLLPPVKIVDTMEAKSEAAAKQSGNVPERGLLAAQPTEAQSLVASGRNIASPSSENGVVYIVIDSGFNPESLPPKESILGVWDPTGEGVFNDPLQHGSVILNKLREGDPEAKFMLIRAYDGSNNLARTQFEHGQIARPGWTEAYLEAVALADKLKLPSVANCSFGEFTHAMDGTGWESFQLSHSIGEGKAGHVVVAATGPGNGAARHASGMVETGKAGEVNISQNGEAAFNLWMNKDAPRDWNLRVYEGNRQIYNVDGSAVVPNFWNNRQQITFRSHIEGSATRFVLSRQGADPRPLSFDFFVQEGKASFLDHVNPELISEPAVFPQVVAVGLKDGKYSPSQNALGHKPDVLLPGDGPISFRTPEVTLAVGQMLKNNSQLDATQIQALLGKFPQGKAKQ